ncbi:MAG: hypothetical protein IJC37_01605 [Clostridia bacterium]|nr:hypothetical protein [Clostridia bacterium]
MAYYIGVDGGGTKTAFALFNENKEMLASVTGAGSNHENIDTAFVGASAVIWEGLCELVKSAGITIDDVDFTLMGLAGIDHPYQHDIMCDMLREKGLKNFEIFNDGFIVVKAGSISGAAIGYNCGTGVCCNAVDSKGNMLQLAGLGNFTGDFGGGLWVREQAYKLVYDELFVCGEKTALTQKFFDEFGFNSRDDLLDFVAKLEDEDADTYIRKVVGMLFEAAENGDEPALGVVKATAKRGAQFISSLAKQMDFDGDEVEVVLSGSINVKLNNPTYVKLLKEQAVELSGKKLNFITLNAPPVTGCVNWILQDYVK